jgi:CDP-diglyceride synthetase
MAVMRHRMAGAWSWWINAALLVAIPGGLVWAVIAEERDTAAYLAIGAWLLLMALVVPRNTPQASVESLGLIVVICAGATVGFLQLYRWAEWPVMGYIYSFSTASASLQAVFLLLAKWLGAAPNSGPKEMVGEPPLADQVNTLL